MTPTQQNVIKEAEKIIIKQSAIINQKERPVKSLPMDVTGLRQAVLELWEDEVKEKEDALIREELNADPQDEEGNSL